MSHGTAYAILIVAYAVVQVAYLGSFAVTGYFFSRKVDWIDPGEVGRPGTPAPPILLLYPVLREAEGTMRTTMLSIRAAQQAYPGVARVVAVPNWDDTATIASLERLTGEFDFLEIVRVPPTTDASWAPVWESWEANPKAYWWHTGKRAGERALPPKKTRQMIYTLYTLAPTLRGGGWLLSYLDADSAVPVEYYGIAAAGAARFDVVQLTNVAGNLLQSWASSFHAMDHMAWDGALYPHMTARGRHPFYVLGKGLFFRVSDLVELGGFHPWLTIEDPEVGMRLWANGRTLGVSDSPLIEEVPVTFRDGVIQRKRWVAGFFQSLALPPALMGMTFTQRLKARLNLIPCLSLALNAVGLPVGVWALVEASLGRDPVDLGLTVLSGVDVVAAALVLGRIYAAAWRRSAMVLATRRSRLWYVARVNPVFILVYWLLWLLPLTLGTYMFVRDRGLVWQRTEKVDANHELVRQAGALADAPPVPAIDLRDGQVIDVRDGAPSGQPSGARAVGAERSEEGSRAR